MTITKMLTKIKEYHAKLGYSYEYDSVEQQVEHIRQLALAQVVEVTEFIDWTPWKPWRSLEDQSFDKKEAALEVVDQLFFASAMFFAIGLEPEDIEELFTAKLLENLDRINRGYNIVQENGSLG